MKHIMLAFGFLLLSSGPGLAQPLKAEERRSAGEVLAAVAKWADAVRDRDQAALEKLFADEMIVTTGDGKTRGKAEELEVLKPDPNPKLRTISVVNENVRVKVYGDVAVVTSLTRMRLEMNGIGSEAAMRYTAVFVKRDGRWQIAALHTTRAPQGS